jgi:hypothetical protein
MFVAAIGALVVAQAGSVGGPMRLPVALNCVAVPVLMSAPADAGTRRAARPRSNRPAAPRTPRCVRLSAR